MDWVDFQDIFTANSPSSKENSLISPIKTIASEKRPVAFYTNNGCKTTKNLLFGLILTISFWCFTIKTPSNGAWPAYLNQPTPDKLALGNKKNRSEYQ